MMGGTITLTESEVKSDKFETHREPASCFYHRHDSKDETEMHCSLENGSNSFYQNSGRPSSSSLQSALYGGIVTPDGKLHTYHGGTGMDDFEGFKSARNQKDTFAFDDGHNGGIGAVRDSQVNAQQMQ